VATSGHYAICELTAEVGSLEFDKSETQRSIPHRFARLAQEHPHAPAVRDRDRIVTYQELDALGNRIAHRILADYGQRQLQVGLVFPLTIESIAAHLGVLKAGKTAIAIDPAFPQMRAAELLMAAGAELALCDPARLDSTRSLNVVGQVLDIGRAIDGMPEYPPEVLIDADDPAAIVFTSGSSGRPKGIVHTHRTLLHRCWSDTHYLQLSRHDRISLFSSLSFGAGLPQLFAGLLNGACVHPFDLRNREFTEIFDWLWSERISVFWPPVSAFRLFLDSCPGNERYDDCRYVIQSGEATLTRTSRAWRRYFPATCALVCQLATTEAQVVSRYALTASTAVEGRYAPIGYADPDKQVAIVNSAGEPVAPGEIGELVVSSAYLSPGMWSGEANAVRAFPADRLLKLGDGRIGLRTGDLASRDVRGRMHHHGRCDGVIKRHGGRVDFSEVEAALLEYEGISRAVCIARELENHRQQIVAFYVARNARECPTESEIRGWLINRLPDYMVPSRLLAVPELPRTINGKIARCALPNLGLAQRARGAELHTFENQLQRCIVEIWRATIGHDNIGIDDDFFEAGGDHLSVVQAAAAISNCLGRPVRGGEIRETRTIRRLVETLDRADEPLSCIALLPPTSGRPANTRPIFCIYGFYLYRPLAEALGTQFRTLGIQVEPETHLLRTCMAGGRAAGEPAGKWPPSVEQLAGAYVEQMRKRQRTGPYQLLGHAFGGVVAFEMARQLRASGETVSLLCLLDSHAPGAWHPVSPRGWLARAAAWVQNTVPLAFPDTRADRHAREAHRLRMEKIALATYAPQPYAGNAVLFMANAKREIPGMAVADNLGWPGLVSGQLRVHEIVGDGQSICRRPSVDSIAALLRPMLHRH
jgi:acyl-coenzyme A synthetase/AMP-(fatty) acid ligase/thioesterase domain-containing protein